MKGKKILTLVSLAMGIAIVGGTFAAWAVTDNADPFGIKVSPGQVGPDTTQYVTLSYGESSFANVNNLEAGKPRLAGSVVLKADTKDGTVFPYAIFDIELQDQSNGKAAGEARLVDLLKVDVYKDKVIIDSNGVALPFNMPEAEGITDQETMDAFIQAHGPVYTIEEDVATSQTVFEEETEYHYKGTALTPIGCVPVTHYEKDTTVVSEETFNASKVLHGKLYQYVTAESKYVEIAAYNSEVHDYYYLVNVKEASIPVTIPSGTGLPVWTVVSLDAGTDAKTLEDIAKDVVYLEMELNADPNGDYVTSTTVYVSKPAGTDEEVYCYAWSANNKNAEWPGVAMSTFSVGSYSYELKQEFTNLIFHSAKKVGADWVSSWQTVDLTFDHTSTANPCFTPNGSPEAEGPDAGKYRGSWGTAPNPDIQPGYYVVGDFSNPEWTVLSGNLMTKDQNNPKHYTLSKEFEAGDTLKVTNQNKTVWYSSVSTWEGCGFTIDEEGNLVVTDAGTYTVNLYLEGDGGNCVTLGLPVPVEVNYYLVGSRNFSGSGEEGASWEDVTKGFKLTVNPDNPNEYTASISLNVNDEFRIRSDETTPTWADFEIIDAEDNAFKAGDLELSGNNAKVKVAGTYTLYYKVGTNLTWVSALAD